MPTTVNQLIMKIADRAGELSKMGKRELVLTHPDNVDGTTRGPQWEGYDKSKLITDILYDEFELEFDITIDD